MDFAEPEDFILIKNPEVRALMVQKRENHGFNSIQERPSFKYVSSLNTFGSSIINQQVRNFSQFSKAKGNFKKAFNGTA